MGSTGKRMYCPKCNKNRTWNSAYKKREMEPGEKPYDFRFYVCKTCEYAYDPKTSLEITDWRAKYYGAESFEAVVVENRKPKGIIGKVLMQQGMMMKVQLQELDLRLDTDIRLGRISLAQADEIRERALIKMGLIHADFNAEKWDDVEWADPHNQARKTVIPDWEADIDWSDDFQSTKALDYLEGLAKGTETTELDSRFLLSRRHFSQLLARLGSKMSIDDFETTIHGFGEGPYPVAQSILSVNEIITQTELQLHTIFEAFESVLEGVPTDHDGHDDHDDHEEFETIISLYKPYVPAKYRVLVNTFDGVENMGEFSSLVAAQELADDWNAPDYNPVMARIEKIPHQNGAFRGHSRVVFEDGSYLHFFLVGDLIHRDVDLVNMTSLFIKPSDFPPDVDWWETQRNN
jgi:hypothetical protein